MNEKFFVRGNLALDWEHVIGTVTEDYECAFVTVSMMGEARVHENAPACYPHELRWAHGDNPGVLLGRVGEQCPDWQELIFERPQAPRLPDGFWEAVDMVCGRDVDFVVTGKEYTIGEVTTYNYERCAFEHSEMSRSLRLTRRPNLEIGKH